MQALQHLENKSHLRRVESRRQARIYQLPFRAVHLHPGEQDVFGQEDYDIYPGRTLDLRCIKRFKDYNRMVMRTDLAIHSERTASIVNVLYEVGGGSSDNLQNVVTEAYVHDDPEISTGDISTVEKAVMGPEEKDALRSWEISAMYGLASGIPKFVNGLPYHGTMVASSRKSGYDGAIRVFSDKIDGFYESMREVLLGNRDMIEPMRSYIYLLNNVWKSHPQLDQLLTTSHPLVKLPGIMNEEDVISGKKTVGYEAWKSLSLKYLGRREMEERRE